MKEITKRSKNGKDITYLVFESTTEAINILKSESHKHLNTLNQNLDSITPFRLWYEGEKYEWVKSDDGAIVQIQNRWYWNYGKYKGQDRDRVKYCIKVPFGVYYRSTKKDGNWTSERMIAMPKLLNEARYARNSISGIYYPTGAKYMNLKKKLFAFYCVTLGNPLMAWVLVTGKNISASKKTAIATYNTVVLLLDEEQVRNEIKKYMPMEDFQNRVKKTLEDKSITLEKMLDEFSEGIKGCKKGSMVHKQWFETGMALLRYAEGKTESLAPPAVGKPLDYTDKPLEIDAQFTDILPDPPEELKEHVSPKVVEYIKKHNEETLDKIEDDILNKKTE